jgi:ketosteroid isomerase-like protein
LVAVIALIAAAACSRSDEADLRILAERSAAASGASACGVTNAAVVRRAIDSTIAHADESLRRGDSASLWNLYADDAIFMWDNQRSWHGKAEAQREAPKVLGDLVFTDHKQTIDDMIVCGDLAVHTGTFEMKLRRKNGEEVTGRGRNLIVWKRQLDGAWRIVRNLGNDVPATQG